MTVPRIRVRTLMFMVWLSALLCAGTVDVLREQRERNRVEVIEEHADADGSTSSTLLWRHIVTYYIGPIPIGPWPVAVLSGVAFAVSVVAWALCRRSTNPARRPGNAGKP